MARLKYYNTETGQWEYADGAAGHGGLPEVTADDDNKILQVVNGSWAVVALADSAVKTYVDDYINQALGGEY